MSNNIQVMPYTSFVETYGPFDNDFPNTPPERKAARRILIKAAKNSGPLIKSLVRSKDLKRFTLVNAQWSGRSYVVATTNTGYSCAFTEIKRPFWIFLRIVMETIAILILNYLRGVFVGEKVRRA